MPRPDSDIREDVLRELAWESGLHGAQVGVQVFTGVVVLTGIVKDAAAARAASEAAHRVSEVKDIVSDLEVAAGGSDALDDLTVARGIRQSLVAAPMAPAESIRTTVSRGVVTLRGTVRSARQRRNVESAVRRSPGVRKIENLIQVEARAGRRGVEQAIQRALKVHAVREGAHLKISITDGRIHVTGPVDSSEERRAILGAIRSVPGVESVDDQLRVTGGVG